TSAVRLFVSRAPPLRPLHSFPTRRSSDLALLAPPLDDPVISRVIDPVILVIVAAEIVDQLLVGIVEAGRLALADRDEQLVHDFRSEEHTPELQSLSQLVCRPQLEKKKLKT